MVNNNITLQNYKEGVGLYLRLTGELRRKIETFSSEKDLAFYRDKYATLIQNILYLRGKTLEKGKKGACKRYSESELKKRVSFSNNKFLGTPKIIDKKIFSLIQELEENLEEYIGNENQVKLAKKIGISHLGKLYTELSILGYVGKLKYNNIHLPVKQVELLIQELEEKLEDYVGNENQVKLAKKIGISNLGQLYSALSTLGYVGKLKYNNINLPVANVINLGPIFLKICNLKVEYGFNLTDIIKKSLTEISLYTEFILFLFTIKGKKYSFSQDRLICYMLKNVTKENMQYFKDILLDSTRYLEQINNLIYYEEKQELSDLEQILLTTYKSLVEDYKKTRDVMGKKTITISQNGGLETRKNGESFEVGMKGDEENPQENFEKQELTELLERELPPKIYELLQEGSNMGEVISWIQENKPYLFEDLREFV